MRQPIPRLLSALVALTAAAGLAAAPAVGAIDFRGDWEQAVTGTQPPVPWEALEYGGQFDGSPAISEQLQIVTAPVRQGSKAAKFVVHPGDQYGGSSGERALARWLASDEREGQEYYYGWSTLFPTDWSGESGWQIITEWHTDQRFPIPPVRLDAKTNSLSLWITAGQCYLNGSSALPCQYDLGHTLLTNLNKGRWNDFIVRIVWSKAATGAVQVWHRVEGQSTYTQVLDLNGVPTLPWRSGDSTPADIYVLHGLYRNNASIVNTIYHDNFVRGTTWAEVAATFPDVPTVAPPPPPPPPPPPAPSPPAPSPTPPAPAPKPSSPAPAPAPAPSPAPSPSGGPLEPPSDPARTEAAASRAVSFLRRPTLVGPRSVRIQAMAAPGAFVVAMARDRRAKAVGALTMRADATGKIDAVLRLERRPRHRVVLTLVVQTTSGPQRATWSVEPRRAGK